MRAPGKKGLWRRPSPPDDPSSSTISAIRRRMASRLFREGVLGSELDEPDSQDQSHDDVLLPLLDAVATTVHVLTFYQDRIDDEAALCTAREDRSVLELLSPFGLAPTPALAASALVAFEVSKLPDGGGVPIPAGTMAQSVPDVGQAPQIYETVEPIVAWEAVNNIQVLAPAKKMGPHLWGRSIAAVVRGSAALVKPGLRVLLTGQVKGASWQVVRTVRRIGRLPRRGYAIVAWDEPLFPDEPTQAIEQVRLFTLGNRQSVFGADAELWANLEVYEQLQYAEAVGGVYRRGADPKGDFEHLFLDAKATRVLCLHEDVDGALYAGVSGRGVVKSVDNGASWSSVDAGLRRVDVLCFANEPDGALVVGTRNKGVFRSTDGGESWVALRGTTAVKQAWPTLKRVSARLPQVPIRALLSFSVAYEDAERVYVIAGTDAGLFWFERGSGEWRPAHDGLPVTVSATEAAIVVHAIAAGRSLYIATDHGLFRTERLGMEWSPCDPLVPGAPANSVAIDGEGNVVAALRNGGVYRSNDGDHWVHCGTTDEDPFATIEVRHVTTVSGGAGDFYFVATNGGLFQSTNRGATWTRITKELHSEDVEAVLVTTTGELLVATPLTGSTADEWPGFNLDDAALDLAREVPPLPKGAIVVIEEQSSDSVRQCFLKVQQSVNLELAAFGKQKRITRLLCQQQPLLTDFARRSAGIFLASRDLRLATRQLADHSLIANVEVDLAQELAVPGVFDQMTSSDIDPGEAPTNILELAGVLPDLAGREVGIVGRPYRLSCCRPFTLVDDGRPLVTVQPEEILTILSNPEKTPEGVLFRLETRRGLAGEAVLAKPSYKVLSADPDSATIVQIRWAKFTETLPHRTRLHLLEPLSALLDVDATRLYGNVVHARHGLATEEVLGSGNASVAGQEFTLRQSPMSWYLRHGKPECSLEVLVSNIPWQRVAELQAQGPTDHVYTLTATPDGQNQIRFGDGWHGARLPTGTENVVARFHLGAGPGGDVAPGQIRTLRNPPPNVRRVRSLTAATGGTPAEDIHSLKRRAAKATRTLDRIVSLTDFEDYVGGMRGVALVDANLVWGGHQETICVTVAVDEAADLHRLQQEAPLRDSIHAALRQFRLEGQALRVVSFKPRMFALSVDILVDGQTDVEEVESWARAVLTEHFCFDNRHLGQEATALEVVWLLASGERVIDVRVVEMVFVDTPAQSGVPARLLARRARWSNAANRLEGSEMLLLSTKDTRLSVRRQGE
ncbi:MAG: hypothetical protein HN348_06525 [Proteobacteria bacterium]|nr:hypothetical protein [Pseudomonadota bacterium]